MEPYNDMEMMSSRLLKAMHAKGLNSSQLAARVGISRSAMSLFLCGKRPPGRMVLAKLADQLSVTADYLLGRTNESHLAELLENPRIVRLVQGFIVLADRDQQRVLDMLDLVGRTGDKETSEGSETLDDPHQEGTD